MKNTLKQIGYMGIFVLIGQSIYAQREPLYTQYMYNTSVINPGYTGTRGNLNVFGLYRTQMVGFDGAPKTANLAIDAPIHDSNFGVGLNFINDKIGATTENTITANVSYGIDLSADWRMNIGVDVVGDILNVDYTKLDIYDGLDKTFQENINDKFKPNLGVGLYAYSEKAYVGISVPTIFETEGYKNNDDRVLMKQKVNFNFIGGYVFDISYDFKLKPAVMVRTVRGGGISADITANAIYADRFTLGVSYRWDASVSGLVGFQIDKSIFIGYSYDASVNNLSRYNNGSHEFFLRFDIFSRKDKVSTSRFF